MSTATTQHKSSGDAEPPKSQDLASSLQILADSMLGLDLTITVSDRTFEEARALLNFLRKAARRHYVAFSVTAQPPKGFRCYVSEEDGERFNLFLQELIFNQGLYYYLCSVPKRRYVAISVVRPIFQELLENRFRITYPSIVRDHVLEGSLEWILAGTFVETTAQEFEVLFQRLKLEMISGYEFIRNLDDLLTKFMLSQLKYVKGEETPKFNLLVSECGKKDIVRDRDVRKLFNKVHSLRTHGLHRLEREIPYSEVSQVALQMYWFFEWLDDYHRAQEQKTVRLAGKRYRRIRYGYEIRHYRCAVPRGFRARWKEIITRPCHDCGVIRGELHLEGCDMDICPRCAGQYMCCSCRRDDEEEV